MRGQPTAPCWPAGPTSSSSCDAASSTRAGTPNSARSRASRGLPRPPAARTGTGVSPPCRRRHGGRTTASAPAGPAGGSTGRTRSGRPASRAARTGPGSGPALGVEGAGPRLPAGPVDPTGAAEPQGRAVARRRPGQQLGGPLPVPGVPDRTADVAARVRPPDEQVDPAGRAPQPLLPVLAGRTGPILERPPDGAQALATRPGPAITRWPDHGPSGTGAPSSSTS